MVKIFFLSHYLIKASREMLDMLINFSLTPDNFHKSITQTLLSRAKIGLRKVKKKQNFLSNTLKSAILAVFDSQKPYQVLPGYTGPANGFWMF